MDLEALSKEDLILQLILSSRPSGQVLTYSDYDLIQTWLTEARSDADLLMLALSEVLASPAVQKNPKIPLNLLRKRVSKKISELMGSAPFI